MDLILWRHAAAQDWVLECDDMQRGLTPQSRKQAARMAVWLDGQLPKGARIWVALVAALLSITRMKSWLQLSDSLRVFQAGKLRSWISKLNDCFGEIASFSSRQASVRFRCRPVLKLPTAKISNADLARAIEGQLYGTPPSIRRASLDGFNGQYRAGISINSNSAMGTLQALPICSFMTSRQQKLCFHIADVEVRIQRASLQPSTRIGLSRRW